MCVRWLAAHCTMHIVDLQRITYLIYARPAGSMRPNEEIMKLGKKCLQPNINPTLPSPFLLHCLSLLDVLA